MATIVHPTAVKVFTLNVGGLRYAELRSAAREISILDIHPERKDSAETIISDHIAELRERARRLVARADGIEADLRAFK